MEESSDLDNVTRTKVRRALRHRTHVPSVTLAVGCNKVGPPREEWRVNEDAAVGAEFPGACLAASEALGESELGSSLSQCWG